jgi:hypothetical protein
LQRRIEYTEVVGKKEGFQKLGRHSPSQQVSSEHNIYLQLLIPYAYGMCVESDNVSGAVVICNLKSYAGGRNPWGKPSSGRREKVGSPTTYSTQRKIPDPVSYGTTLSMEQTIYKQPTLL